MSYDPIPVTTASMKAPRLLWRVLVGSELRVKLSGRAAYLSIDGSFFGSDGLFIKSNASYDCKLVRVEQTGLFLYLKDARCYYHDGRNFTQATERAGAIGPDALIKYRNIESVTPLKVAKAELLRTLLSYIRALQGSGDSEVTDALVALTASGISYPELETIWQALPEGPP